MAIDFKVGEFREQVLLQRQVAEQSPTGAVQKKWVDDRRVFAKAELVATGESVREGGRITNLSTYKLTTYTLPGVDTSYRVVWRGKVYEMIAIEPLRYTFVELTIVG